MFGSGGVPLRCLVFDVRFSNIEHQTSKTKHRSGTSNYSIEVLHEY